MKVLATHAYHFKDIDIEPIKRISYYFRAGQIADLLLLIHNHNSVFL